MQIKVLPPALVGGGEVLSGNSCSLGLRVAVGVPAGPGSLDGAADTAGSGSVPLGKSLSLFAWVPVGQAPLTGASGTAGGDISGGLWICSMSTRKPSTPPPPVVPLSLHLHVGSPICLHTLRFLFHQVMTVQEVMLFSSLPRPVAPS